MVERPDEEGAALWRRWRREIEAPETAADEALAVMRLAAHADGRLAADERAAVEALAAERPELAEDLAAARALAAAPEASGIDAARLDRLVRRAGALVPGEVATVVPFRAVAARAPLRRSPFWRSTASWAALAASFALTGYFGFALGSDAYSMIAEPDSGAALHQELLDPPSGFFGGIGDFG